MAKKKTTEDKEVVAVAAPPIEPGMINVPFSRSDLVAYTNLLSICAQTFEQMALQVAQQEDTKAFDIFSSRHKMVTMLANKLAAHCYLGEPESRGVH